MSDATVLISENILQETADAIRSKINSNKKIAPKDFAETIEAITINNGSASNDTHTVLNNTGGKIMFCGNELLNGESIEVPGHKKVSVGGLPWIAGTTLPEGTVINSNFALFATKVFSENVSVGPSSSTNLPTKMFCLLVTSPPAGSTFEIFTE